MRRVRLILLSFGLSLACNAASATDAGPTTLETSRFMGTALKSAMLDAAPTAYDEACVERIPTDFARPILAQHISASLSAEEIVALDAFFSSELGRRFVSDGIARNIKQPEKYPRITFSEDERNEINRYFSESPLPRLFEEVIIGNQPMNEALRAALKPQMDLCLAPGDED